MAVLSFVVGGGARCFLRLLTRLLKWTYMDRILPAGLMPVRVPAVY